MIRPDYHVPFAISLSPEKNYTLIFGHFLSLILLDLIELKSMAITGELEKIFNVLDNWYSAYTFR